ncbi:MAG TPA: CPBP family intramembrane glutamic endopeptidase [Polyangiaceae bacterium]|nr:CPBP family intramembrane glutamic endopeptidase [Polyangiaceae bacterium]
MKRLIAVVLVLAVANGLAFRDSLAGSPVFLWTLAVPYLALCGLAFHHFWDEGTLLDRLKPRGGDISIGAVSALVLLFASWLGRSALAPSGTPRQAWLYRIYLQLGDPEILQHSVTLTLLLLFIAAAEEIVWRGLVLALASERFGTRRGWLITTVLYAATICPTAYFLRDPEAGLNPLLPTAALGAGLVWGFLAGRLGRLMPVVVSHMAFTYFSAVQFRWPMG